MGANVDCARGLASEMEREGGRTVSLVFESTEGLGGGLAKGDDLLRVRNDARSLRGDFVEQALIELVGGPVLARAEGVTRSLL